MGIDGQGLAGDERTAGRATGIPSRAGSEANSRKVNGVGVSQAAFDKMNSLAAAKPDGVYGYNGQYYYAVKSKTLVLIGYRFSGEVWAVSGSFLIERQTQLRKDLKSAMKRSIYPKPVGLR